MIYVDLYLHKNLVATWEYKSLTRAVAACDWVHKQIEKAEKKNGIEWARVKRVEDPNYPEIKTDAALLRFTKTPLKTIKAAANTEKGANRDGRQRQGD